MTKIEDQVTGAANNLIVEAKKAWASMTLWFNWLIALLTTVPMVVANISADPSYNLAANLLDTGNKKLGFLVVVVVVNIFLRYKTKAPIMTPEVKKEIDIQRHQ